MIGEIKEILYENSNWLNQQDMSLPAYIIAQFNSHTIPKNMKCFLMTNQ